jgi:hypothetical protein
MIQKTAGRNALNSAQHGGELFVFGHITTYLCCLTAFSWMAIGLP